MAENEYGWRSTEADTAVYTARIRFRDDIQSTSVSEPSFWERHWRFSIGNGSSIALQITKELRRLRGALKFELLLATDVFSDMIWRHRTTHHSGKSTFKGLGRRFNDPLRVLWNSATLSGILRTHYTRTMFVMDRKNPVLHLVSFWQHRFVEIITPFVNHFLIIFF